MPIRRALFALSALALTLLALLRLETIRGEVSRDEIMLGTSPATLYQRADPTEDLVIVSHGFAGSRQMMEAISLTLARAGHHVVAFDYQGHGTHTAPLSPDFTTLTGTTEDLVQQTLEVVTAARTLTDVQRTSLIGHSMATDVVIRAAARLPGVENVVAISMYSEAVTPQHPDRLLIVSGAQEGRLREVALDAVAQLGKAIEGETVQADGITRRAIAAPLVGHVGVLWSGVTASEIATWLGTPIGPTNTGIWIAALLLGIAALFWPLAAALPKTDLPPPASTKTTILACACAVLLALAASFIDLPVLGLAGFGALWAFLLAWGLTVLTMLRWRPASLNRRDLISAALLLIWGLGAFAAALDRYGAAFLPTGPRLPLMLLLLPATLVFATADRALVQGRGLLMRAALRLPVILTLFGAMMLNTQSMGMLFTVLPVLVLFLVVYGTMAFWAAQRSGPLGPMLASGVILAWSIAASTPLFSAG